LLLLCTFGTYPCESAYLSRKEQYGPDTGYYMCIAMPDEGKEFPTKIQLIQSPGEEAEAIEYSFPHCFWTHDKNQFYADQPHVYSRIGKPLLHSLYQGMCVNVL